MTSVEESTKFATSVPVAKIVYNDVDFAADAMDKPHDDREAFIASPDSYIRVPDTPR